MTILDRVWEQYNIRDKGVLYSATLTKSAVGIPHTRAHCTSVKWVRVEYSPDGVTLTLAYSWLGAPADVEGGVGWFTVGVYEGVVAVS